MSQISVISVLLKTTKCLIIWKIEFLSQFLHQTGQQRQMALQQNTCSPSASHFRGPKQYVLEGYEIVVELDIVKRKKERRETMLAARQRGWV